MIDTALSLQKNLAMRLIGALPLPLIQPALTRIVRRIAATHREIFDRLGPYREATYVIEPTDMPFLLVLRPNPDRPQLRAARPRCMTPTSARTELWSQLNPQIPGWFDSD